VVPVTQIEPPLFEYCEWAFRKLPWIPEPSTVNNKLKRREGSGSTEWFMNRFCTKTTNSVLWLERFIQRIFPLNQSLRDVSIFYLLSKALESRVLENRR
jgi:hypothetical protein